MAVWNKLKKAFTDGFNAGLRRQEGKSVWETIKNEFWKGYSRGYLKGFLWGLSKREQLDRDMEAFRRTFANTMKNWKPKP